MAKNFLEDIAKLAQNQDKFPALDSKSFGRLDLEYYQQLSRLVEKPTMWFPNRSDSNQAVQLQKTARSLKFWS